MAQYNNEKPKPEAYTASITVCLTNNNNNNNNNNNDLITIQESDIKSSIRSKGIGVLLESTRLPTIG